jgi:hypothetical protein
MCSLDDAWGTTSAQQRLQFAAAPDSAYARYGQQAVEEAKQVWRERGDQWYSGAGPKRGHFSCSGGFVPEEAPAPTKAIALPVQALPVAAQTQAQAPAQPIIIQTPARDDRAPPQVYVVTEPSCTKSWEHMLGCPLCRQGQMRLGAPFGQGLQLQWWHLLLAVIGTALLAALFLRVLMPSAPTTIYRQIGIKA